MARFPRSGTNWEGRKWSIPPSLNALLTEIEAAYPAKRSLDATVAGKKHDQNNPRSDHRPKPYTGTGKVRAADIGEIEPEGEVIAEAIRKKRDPRIRYVIHEGRMFSSYSTSKRKAWAWGPYSGYNAHLTHVHVSVNESNQNDGKAWNLGLGGSKPKPPPSTDWTGKVIMALPTLRKGDGIVPKTALSGDVKRLQGLLLANGRKVAIDGRFGSNTESEVKVFQKAKKLTVDGIVGKNTWTKLLGE